MLVIYYKLYSFKIEVVLRRECKNIGLSQFFNTEKHLITGKIKNVHTM